MSRPIIRVIPRRRDRRLAIDIAELCYARWMGSVSFADDLSHYLLNGMVLSRPDIFAMVTVIDLAPEGAPPEPAWFVRMAVGDLRELISVLPGYLPKICFCRRGDGRMRTYSLDRFTKVIGKIRKGKP